MSYYSLTSLKVDNFEGKQEAREPGGVGGETGETGETEESVYISNLENNSLQPETSPSV